MTKILLVGEAWGNREERFQHPFVGPSGAELARMLAQSGVTPAFDIPYPSELDMILYWKKLRVEHGIEIANVFNLHPVENMIDTFFTTAKEGVTSIPPLKAGKYLRPDLMHHVEKLWHKIETEKPNLIIALGNTPCWSVLGESKISTIRGTVKMSPRFNVKVLPTYHPAAVLRQWNLRTVVLSDFEKAKEEANYPHIKRVERFVVVEPTVEEILEWSTRSAEYYSVDIETIRGKRSALISMIGFARSPYDALVIPFYDERKETGNYWPDVRTEMKVWRLVNFLLKRPVPKVFQNGVFDLTHLLRAGMKPTLCNEDTMLLHHSLYPEMLKGLGFLGSIYSNEIAWKSMRKKGDNLKRDE
jgi:hypothetical protein